MNPEIRCQAAKGWMLSPHVKKKCYRTRLNHQGMWLDHPEKWRGGWRRHDVAFKQSGRASRLSLFRRLRHYIWYINRHRQICFYWRMIENSGRVCCGAKMQRYEVLEWDLFSDWHPGFSEVHFEGSDWLPHSSLRIQSAHRQLVAFHLWNVANRPSFSLQYLIIRFPHSGRLRMSRRRGRVVKAMDC